MAAISRAKKAMTQVDALHREIARLKAENKRLKTALAAKNEK